MKPKTYWAGFVDGKIDIWLFETRKDAKLYFDDVRKVEIREVK